MRGEMSIVVPINVIADDNRNIVLIQNTIAASSANQAVTQTNVDSPLSVGRGVYE